MNRIKRFAQLSILFCLQTILAYSQTTPAPQIGKVSGKVVDAQNKPVSYATVTLLRSDASVVSGDLSKDDGSFSIGPTGTGTFTLRINAIGLQEKSISVEVTADAPDKNVGSVKVVASATSLKSVEVVGERPLMEMSVDKKVFNVEKNITTAGGSATDVLSNVPAVTVDADGNVSLRGKSDVTVLIDGKPATLLGSDVTSALQSLPGSSIESVEVITNPSAKYDAQGLTGIINIVTKKDKKLGINGSITLGIGTGDKYNGNLSLNARKGKWNVFLNSSFRFNSNYNNTTTDRYNKNIDSGANSFHTYEHAQRHFDGSFNSIGATYDFDKYNSLTFTQNVNLMNFGYTDYSDYSTYNSMNETGDAASLVHRTSDAKGGPLSLSSALDYKHKFKKKKDEELDIDATYSVSNFSRDQHYKTNIDSAGIPIYNGIYETAPGTGTNNSFNAWADYTDPLFTKNGKLGLGWKSQFYGFTSSNNPLVDTPGRAEALDSSLYTKFNYTQQIHAGYINWNDQVGKFSYQAGLRMEDVIYNGKNEVVDNATYNKTYFNLFPSAFISYQLPKQQSIYLNYSRRTNRPNFWQLLPFKDVSNPGVVSEGNPNLDPEFIHNIEFSYSKQTTRGDNFIANIYYQYTQNLIERITRTILPSDSGLGAYIGRQFTQPQNLASGVTYGFEGTGHIQILPIWDATLDVNLFQNEIKVGNVDAASRPYVADNSGFSWFGKLNTNVKLSKGLSLQIVGNYESAKPIAQGRIDEIWWMDAALRWNFLKNNKATLVLNVSDIFNTHKSTTVYDLTAYTETYYRDRETRIGNLTFTYRFGKSDFGSKAGKGKGKNQQNAKPGEEDRENNLKQGEDNDQGGGGQGGNGGGQGGGAKGGGGGAHS